MVRQNYIYLPCLNKNNMPVNKDALKRYRIIDRLLSDPNRDYTTDKILREVNKECDKVSIRMIQKDIKALEEEFGKKMIRNAGGRGTVKYEDQSEPLFYQELTWEEEEILREVLRSIGQFEGLDNFTWLDVLKKKLEMKDDSRQAPFISFSKNDGLQVPGMLLGRLFDAISKKKVIKVTYTPFNQQSRDFIIHPYQLKQFNDRWFLLCCPVATEQYPFNPEFILTLALDRMSEKFEYVESIDYFECVVDLKARYDEIVGVTLYQDKDLEDIYFAVSPKSVDYIRTKWLHTTQIELDHESQLYFKGKYPMLSDFTFFSIQCRENPELYAKFASYLSDIVLVEPTYMKDQLRERIIAASKQFTLL